MTDFNTLLEGLEYHLDIALKNQIENMVVPIDVFTAIVSHMKADAALIATFRARDASRN